MIRRRPIRSHTFRGKRYRIQSRPMPKDDGVCDPPERKNKTIKLDSRNGGMWALRVFLDEAIHACFFDLDNDMVGDAADSIARFLWRQGYRREEDEE